MNSTFHHLVRLLLATACAPSLAAAQSAGPALGPVLYRLGDPSAYVEGCAAPCFCPMDIYEDLRGTFTLEFSHATADWYAVYDIEDIHWVMTGGADDRHVTGKGTYMIGGAFALQERLQLELVLDEVPLESFDSGFVPWSGQSFPNFDLFAQQLASSCFIQEIMVDAAPVPQEEIVPYMLRRSAYAEGCYGVCLCVLNLWRLGGTFDLVPLPGGLDPQRSDFALVALDWATLPVVAPARTFVGGGIYSLNHADGTHRLTLDATDNVFGLQHYDSHWLPGGHLFPEIHVDASNHDYFCFDQVLKVHARPQ